MLINLVRKNSGSILLFDFIIDFCDLCLEYASKQSDEKKQKKMVEITPKKYEGIGPTTKEGVPIVLRSVCIKFLIIIYFVYFLVLKVNHNLLIICFIYFFRKLKNLINQNGTSKCMSPCISFNLMVSIYFLKNFQVLTIFNKLLRNCSYLICFNIANLY